ncbi:hypothetical protein LZ30DRAFT_277535 [Colletotrichum cereale]|nr:hypothetical protein LZ30DRAFT_277535 [Colletotrichum cereale]
MVKARVKPSIPAFPTPGLSNSHHHRRRHTHHHRRCHNRRRLRRLRCRCHNHLRIQNCRQQKQECSPSKQGYCLRWHDHNFYHHDGFCCGLCCCKPWLVGVCCPNRRETCSSWSGTVSTCWLCL